MDLLLRLLFEGLVALVRSIQKSRAERELKERGVELPEGMVDHTTSAAEVIASLMQQESLTRTQLAAAVIALEDAQARASRIAGDLAALRGAAILSAVIRDQLLPALDALRGPIRELRDRAGTSAGPKPRLQLADIYRAAALVQELDERIMQVSVLEALGASRVNPDVAHSLTDAESIAETLLTPIQQFAAAQDVRLPAQRPIAAPAQEGGESIWFGLLPPDYPILFVPADFHKDLHRYASVPHELGHLLWRAVPGLADEVLERSGIVPMEGLFYQSKGRFHGHLDQLYSAWLPEIWADFVAVLLAGPAAAFGLLHSFADPDQPLRTACAVAYGDSYAEHPPALLRIHLAAHLLVQLGFDAEAKTLVGEWEAIHKEQPFLLVDAQAEDQLRLGFAPVLRRGQQLVEQLYEIQWRTLSGFRLADIPGMEMGPGLWAKVQARAEMLAADQPFNDSGRVVLCAAIVARRRHPARSLVIALGLRRAILGRDTDERRVADPAFQHRRGVGVEPGFNEEIRAALIMREVLFRPPRGRLGRQPRG